MFPKRPKKGDDENELLAYQEEFLRSKTTPAASVTRIIPQCEQGVNEKQQTDVLLADAVPSKDHEVEDVQLTLDTVKERVYGQSFQCEFGRTKTSRGFPEILHLPTELVKGLSKASSTDRPKKSLFAQQIAKQKLRQPLLVSEVPSVNTCSISEESDLHKHIDMENQQKLSVLSPEEILSQQMELLNSLDPAHVALLRNRKRSADHSKQRVQEPQQIIMLPEPDRPPEKDIVQKIDIAELPFKPDERWLHMDKVEHDKLAWTTTPKLSQPNTTGDVSARFNFSGDLIDPSQAVPDTAGLHHHGDDPHLAGYTLEELFILVRSLNLSQKVLALSTLANIITKAKEGAFIHNLNSPVIQPLLDADVVMLLRYALDERSDLVIAAAVNAWRALLVNNADERLLSDSRFAYHGVEVPQLSPPAPSSIEGDRETEEEQLQDILRRDVINGVLMMNFLPRLRYVLEVVCPQRRVVEEIFDILCRVAQTSADVAYKLTLCPRLLDVVFEQFLPLEGVSEHRLPCPEAMRLMYVLVAAGKHMANTLLAERGLMYRILRYLATQSGSALGLSEVAYCKLLVESLSVWRFLTLYGLATEHFLDNYSVLVLRLGSEVNPLVQASLLCLMESLLSCAVRKENPVKEVRFGEPSNRQEVGAPINWSHVAGLMQCVYGIMCESMRQFTTSYQDEYATYGLDVLTSSVDFVASYIQYGRTNQLYSDQLINMDAIIKECGSMFDHLFHSNAFSKLLKVIRSESVILHNYGFLSNVSPHSLPSLNSAAKEGKTSVQPVICFQAFLRLLKALALANFPCIKGLVGRCLVHPEVLTFVNKCISTKLCNTENYFIRYDCDALMLLLQLVLLDPSFATKQYHRMSLLLLSVCTLPPAVYQLLNDVVFNDNFISLYNHPEESSQTEAKLFQEVKKALRTVPSTYVSLTLPVGKAMESDLARYNRVVSRFDSMFVLPSRSSVLPSDWPYLPIMNLYQRSNTVNLDESRISPDTPLLIRHCLQTVFLLECCQADVTNLIPITAKVVRVMCTFLLDNSLFLEPDMQTLLGGLLQRFCLHVSRFDFNQSVPGLTSFRDLYSAFVDQFEAVSFCNDVFAQYAVLPMMQRQPSALRRDVWCDHTLLLRSTLLTPSQLPFSILELLYPEETDTAIIMAMARHLLSGTVTLRRNCVLYITALHHVNRFMFTIDGKHVELKSSLLQAAVACTIEPLGHHLTHYKDYSPDSAQGVMCYEKLPAHRLEVLNRSGNR